MTEYAIFVKTDGVWHFKGFEASPQAGEGYFVVEMPNDEFTVDKIVPTLKVKLTYERETKNKVLYRGDQGTGLDSLYIEKSAERIEGRRGYPKTITVTVEFSNEHVGGGWEV